MTARRGRALARGIVLCSLAFSTLGRSAEVQSVAGAAAPPGVVDLGDRDQLKVYPLSLTAQNLNCSQPQDFRFDLSGAPFAVALGDPVVRQVPPGGQKSTPAQLLFSLSPPGPVQGVVATICETCRPIPIFGNNCRADKQLVTLKANVIPAPVRNPAPATQDRGAGATGDSGKTPQAAPSRTPTPLLPVARGRCLADVSANLDAGLEGFLTEEQKKTLDDARRKSAAANAAQAGAYDDLERKKKKKKDCEDELAALKADAAAKAAAADAAADAAGSAQSAANAAGANASSAQASVDNYDADVAAAQKALDAANAAAKAQEAALRAVLAQEKSASAKNVQSAKTYYEEASMAQDAAKASLNAVKASKAAREAALAAANAAKAKAAAAAAEAQAKSDAARAAADAAAAAVAAKTKECLGLAAEAGAAEVKVDDANRNARNAAGAATRAEEKAAGQARRNLDGEIACKEEECEEIKKRWDEHFRRLANARKALEALNYFTEAPAPPPDELWESYGELGYQKFFEGAQAVVEALGKADGLPATVAGVAATTLDVLQAAYGIAKIQQATLTPGTYAHGRTEGETLHKWLQDNNFAHTDKGDADAKAVEHEMERLMRDPDVIAKDLDRAIKEMEKCKEELAAMKAMKK